VKGWLRVVALAFCLPFLSAAASAAEPISTVIRAPALDYRAIAAEDVAREEADLPRRFAIPMTVSLTPDNSGEWDVPDVQSRRWRLRIDAPSANSLNFGFLRYRMTPRGELHIRSGDGALSLRTFTHADNDAHGQLWTPVLLSGQAIIEVTVPLEEVDALELELGAINQGYRGFGTPPLARSGSCQMDVECLGASDPWRQTMDASGVISLGGGTFCSGSLVNNTAGDRKMYFVTAAHCNINASNAASLVVYWNFQNSFCRTPGSAASGQSGDGNLLQFHTGSTFRAAYAPTDFTLVELDDPPQPAFGHYWAGWNRSTANPPCSAASPCVAIHHPNTDEKRITYVTSNMATTSYGGTTSPGDGTHLWAHWATDPPGPFSVPGTTEGGSSGSPLYDRDHRFVGQLHGGPSSCGSTGDNLSDFYGRFSLSWTGGGTNATRASNWLGASNPSAMTTNGIEMGGLFANGFE
jgi:lysyl endopeptidase